MGIITGVKGGYWHMKDLSLLVWLTQLGLSTAVPLAGFILLALWLRSLGWGDWVLWVGVSVGFVCAIDCFRTSLKAMSRISRDKQEEPPLSFNDHD